MTTSAPSYTTLWDTIVSARNKRSVTLNLRTEEGRNIARQLAQWADVVITSFRVSTLEKWGLDYVSLQQINPKLIMLQVTGFGANSSRRNEPGFGKVGEAMSGVVNITGFEDTPPVHTGFSHGDSVTGLMGAFAIQAALYRKHTDSEFVGEWIDLALYESLFRLIEWQVIFYDQLGIVPGRAGNKLAAAPAAVINLYGTSDDRWLTVTSGTPRSVSNVAALVGEPAENYATRKGQAEKSARLDRLLGEWISKRTLAECLEAMKKLEVVASSIYSVEDMVTNQTFRERENIVKIHDPDLGEVRMQNVIPKLNNYSGRIWRSAPSLGQDNDLVYGEWLNIETCRLEELETDGHI